MDSDPRSGWLNPSATPSAEWLGEPPPPMVWVHLMLRQDTCLQEQMSVGLSRLVPNLPRMWPQTCLLMGCWVGLFLWGGGAPVFPGARLTYHQAIGLFHTVCLHFQCPENAAAGGIASGMLSAWEQYGNQKLVLNFINDCRFLCQHISF